MEEEVISMWSLTKGIIKTTYGSLLEGLIWGFILTVGWSAFYFVREWRKKSNA